ncbi:MAG: DUF3261 domain-containing protein [Gammaproteobacteria bacterium]|nr:DUF3261 domain-containing protein [Gammaproteobacteria bacterium]
MSRRLTVATLVMFFWLGGCSSRQLDTMPPPQLLLLPPAEIAGEILLKQAITFEAGGRQQQFLVVARFQRPRLKLVLLLPSGQPLLTLDYDGQKLLQDNQSTVELPGREILASMQFALWPQRSLQRHYPPEAGWQIKTSDRDRTLLTASGVVLKISRESETLVVDNHLHDYRVIIQTLEKKEL